MLPEGEIWLMQREICVCPCDQVQQRRPVPRTWARRVRGGAGSFAASGIDALVGGARVGRWTRQGTPVHPFLLLETVNCPVN
jgi:hypothetical protein